MTDKQINKYATYTTITGVAIVAIVAFAISYSALQATAETYGFAGWQSWLWPILIDLPILVFAIVSLTVERLTAKRSINALVMMVSFSIATVAFNLAHSEVAILNYAVAIVPPIAVIVTFEALREFVAIFAVKPVAIATQIAIEPPKVATIAKAARRKIEVVANFDWDAMDDNDRLAILQDGANRGKTQKELSELFANCSVWKVNRFKGKYMNGKSK